MGNEIENKIEELTSEYFIKKSFEPHEYLRALNSITSDNFFIDALQKLEKTLEDLSFDSPENEGIIRTNQKKLYEHLLKKELATDSKKILNAILKSGSNNILLECISSLSTQDLNKFITYLNSTQSLELKKEIYEKLIQNLDLEQLHVVYDKCDEKEPKNIVLMDAVLKKVEDKIVSDILNDTKISNSVVTDPISILKSINTTIKKSDKKKSVRKKKILKTVFKMNLSKEKMEDLFQEVYDKINDESDAISEEDGKFLWNIEKIIYYRIRKKEFEELNHNSNNYNVVGLADDIPEDCKQFVNPLVIKEKAARKYAEEAADRERNYANRLYNKFVDEKAGKLSNLARRGLEMYESMPHDDRN